MSCLFCLGIVCREKLSPPKGFSTRAMDDYGKESLSKALEFNSNAQWFIAIDEEIQSDIDLAYKIPTSLKTGKLRTAIDFAKPIASKVLILIYDLGTSKEESIKGLQLSELNQTLEKWYAMGAPNKTVYHEFLNEIPRHP